MNDQYLEYIVLLEKTLASFYENTKKIDSFSGIQDVLEFMETHSEGHAAMIEEKMEALQKPHLDPREITEFQNKLTKESAAIIKNRDELQVLDNLAYTEEALGDFYKKIAGTLSELSEHYAKVSKAISDLGNDEYNHRDILLDNKEKLESQ